MIDGDATLERLSQDEDKLIQAYRRLSGKSQRLVLAMAERRSEYKPQSSDNVVYLRAKLDV
jgi:hypothetical protein